MELLEERRGAGMIWDKMNREDRIGQDRTGQDRTGQDRTGQDRMQWMGFLHLALFLRHHELACRTEFLLNIK